MRKVRDPILPRANLRLRRWRNQVVPTLYLWQRFDRAPHAKRARSPSRRPRERPDFLASAREKGLMPNVITECLFPSACEKGRLVDRVPEFWTGREVLQTLMTTLRESLAPQGMV